MGVDVANGAWSGTNYSDLIIGYHTGIRIGAGYSGIRFYNNSPTTDTNNTGNGNSGEALLMTIGGGGSTTSGANVTINNDLYMGDNIHVNNQNGFVNNSSWTRNQTAYGYIDFGPANSGHAHIYTDRSNFYFNKTLISANGNTMWHAGNDGAGSGLDADTLDGIQGANLAPSTFNVSTGASNSNPNSRTDTHFLTNNGNSPFSGLYSHIQNHWWSSVGGNVAQHATTYNGSTARFAVRHRYSSAWTSWSEAWTNNNDGSGSGLDADTVDGIQGASLLRSNASDTVAAGVTYSWTATNTTGLIFTNTSYAKSLHIGGWTSANTAGVSRIRNSNDNLHMDAGSAGNMYLNHYCTGSVLIRGQTAWHAGNDGSGSGLDADTLDGINSSSFLRSDTLDTFTQIAAVAGTGNGYGFWGSTATYSIKMGNNQANHGTVTDYSIHHQMNTTAGRGFTFGPSRTAVTCSINANTGAILSSNNITAYSDIRVKDNIEVIPNALDKLKEISGYTFTRTDVEDKEERYTGVIAQEVMKVLPEAVQLGATEEDTMSVAYGNMVGLLIQAIKEQQAQIENLKEIIQCQ